MSKSIAVKIVNKSLINLDLIAIFPYDVKIQFMETINESIKLGYLKRYTDAQKKRPNKAMKLKKNEFFKEE